MRFAARIPATRAVAIASPFGNVPLRSASSTEGVMRTLAEATASRSVTGLSETSTIRAEARATARTGVEMEALTAASVAALTLYDMAKAADKGIVIGPIQLERKSGGRSGTYQRG